MKIIHKKSIQSLMCLIANSIIIQSFNSYSGLAITNDTIKFNDISQFKYIGHDTSIEESSSNRYNYSTIMANEYPESYDIRELGLVSGTDYQSGYGTCWAFSTIESALSGILEKDPFANFSEWHLSYFTYTGDDSIEMYTNGGTTSPFKKGGNSAFATSTLSKWIGFVSENIVPYESGNTVDESLRYLSEYHLTDAYCFNGAFSTSTFSAYDQNSVKQLIMNGNSVMINMYYNKSSDYYDSQNNSYYCSESNHSVNHGVTIVGWDDNFNSFDNLNTKPKSKGAWLVKNSWGYKFGDYGYFWISYENLPLIDASAYIVDSNENYNGNYYLDDYGWVTSINSLNESKMPFSSSRYSDYAGNIFTATEDCNIDAVGIYTTDYNVQYEISIYKNITDTTTPISNELAHSTSGNEVYMGYHTIKLDESIPISKDEKYSVVVKLKNSSYTNTIAVESSILLFDVNNNVADIYSYNVSKENIINTTNSGESFISNDGTSWTDINGIAGIMSNTSSDFTYKYSPDYDISQLNDGNYALSTLGNVCIKAFTNPKDKVYYSQYGGNLYENEPIELSSSYDDAIIYYTLDGSIPTTNSLAYTSPIVLSNNNTTINARIFRDNTLGSTYSETFTQSKAVLSTLCVKQYNGLEYSFKELEISTDNQPNTDITLKLDDDITSINLYPISTGSIKIFDDTIISGHEYSNISVYDGLTIPIVVSKDGSTTTEYTITIQQESTKNTLLGDINLDNTLSSLDLLLMKQYTLGIIDLSTKQIIHGDYNLDSIINILDILYLKSNLLK